MNTHTTDDTDDVKLTKREAAHVKELEHLARKLEDANLLYGSALDGLTPKIADAVGELKNFDLDGKMEKAEEELVESATGVLKQDVADVGDLESQIAADDDEEEQLLAGDEDEPVETAA